MPCSNLARTAAALALALSPLIAPTALAQCAEGATGNHWWSVQTLYRQTGSFYGSDWRVRPGIDQPGYMIYGPYATQFGVGSHRAEYLLQVDDNTTAPNKIIASLKVYTRLGKRILGQRDLTRRDFLAANDWQFFRVHFENPCFEEVETTIYWHGNAQLMFGQLYIIKN